VSVEATTSTVPELSSATSNELETTTTENASSATTIATSDVTITTTSSSDLSAGTATSISEDETTAESMATAYTETTTTLSETTTTAAQSLKTFQVIAPGNNFQDEYLIGRKTTFQSMGFDLEPDFHTLSFSIEPETSFVREVDGLYWCIQYGSPYSPGELRLCDRSDLDYGRGGFLTCEQTDDRGLEYSVPAVTCGFDMNTFQIVCSDLVGDFTQFYLMANGNRNGLILALGSSDHPPSPDYYTAVELEVTSVRAE
jgi:hypothetical protein